MARAKKRTPKVEEGRPYVEGVAKNLVERASTDPRARPVAFTDAAYRTPPLDDLVVYEL